jgi:hypothetical protein
VFRTPAFNIRSVLSSPICADSNWIAVDVLRKVSILSYGVPSQDKKD